MYFWYICGEEGDLHILLLHHLEGVLLPYMPSILLSIKDVLCLLLYNQPNCQNPPLHLIICPSKSGTLWQLSALLGGRVNSGVDGKSDTTGPTPSLPATHAAEGWLGPLIGGGWGWGHSLPGTCARTRQSRLWPGGPRTGRKHFSAAR